jgi:hypothetical protein
MKTKYWILGFVVLAVVCVLASLPLLTSEDAAQAEIYSDGKLVKTVALSVDQEFTVEGKNTVTVRDGKIAVTWADCPDGYCVRRGFCSSGGDIVCLPNRLVIKFVAEQEIDAVS